MASNTKPDTRAYGSYTQMFLDNDDKHFIDAIRTLPYNEVLSWGGRKHSEGMMPFMESPEDFDYNTMDYIFPPPPTIIPGIGIDDGDGGMVGPGIGWGGDLSDTERDESGGYLFNCIINCERFIRGCNNLDPVRCWYGAVTGSGDISKWAVTSGPVVKFEQDGSDVLLRPYNYWYRYLQDGETSFDIELQYSDIGAGSDEWYYHPLLGRWIKILAGSSVCTTTVTFLCCSGLVGPMFDDDNTPDTIDGIDPIPISLILVNEAGPYTWEIQGTGYSLTFEETSDGNNGLTLDLGGGECGVDFDPFCIITVTDGCERSCEFYILYSGGAWNGCNSASVGGCTGVGNAYYYFIYSGQVFEERYNCWVSGSHTNCPATSECNEIGLPAVPFYCPCDPIWLCGRGLKYYGCA